MKSLIVLCLFALTACLPGQASKPAVQAENLITGAEIVTTVLPDPGAAPTIPGAKPAADTTETAAEQPTEAPAEPATSVPPELLDPVAIKCLKKGGQWVNVGKTGFWACVLPTRDGGKQCRAKTDCQGECLARSGTCSPIDPMFGCNDILTEGGMRVTQCIN